MDEFVRRLTEGEVSSKVVFQKCGLCPNAICKMVMSHVRERIRKEKDFCVMVSKLSSAGNSGGDTESFDSSSNDSSPRRLDTLLAKTLFCCNGLYFVSCSFDPIKL